MKKFIVIGLGVFGYSLSKKLVERGCEVLAVDRDMDKIEQIQNEVTHALCLDSTDEKALTSIGLKDFDTGIVCIGENFEACLLTSVLLKNAGIRKVISRASNPLHIKILQAVRIDEIITPEAEAAERQSYTLSHDSILDMVHIDQETSVAKIEAPREFVGKSIGKLSLRAKFGVNVISINGAEAATRGKTTISNPGAETIIHEKDILMMIGPPESFERLQRSN